MIVVSCVHVGELRNWPVGYNRSECTSRPANKLGVGRRSGLQTLTRYACMLQDCKPGHAAAQVGTSNMQLIASIGPRSSADPMTAIT